MKKVVHIIPVGHTKTTLIEGMRQYPFHKLILVLSKEHSPGEEKAKALAEEIEKEFALLAEIEYLYVELDNIYSAAIEITKAINREKRIGNQVKVNASGSLRTIGISCYLACSITDAELYVALPAYEKGEITGIRTVLDIPAFPVKEVGAEEQRILKSLLESGSTSSVDELIQRIKKDLKTSRVYQKERARMSYHIKKLRKDGFIKTKKEGKNLGIALTELGELYSLGRS